MDKTEAINRLEDLVKTWDGDPFVQKSVDAFKLAIAALREQEQSKWISVKEKLPENSEDVVVCHRNGWVTKDVWLGSNWWHPNKVNPITHWMPLPEPPKEGAVHE